MEKGDPTVGDGREALELVSEKNFDLILLDIEMPEMSGLEVLKALRQSKTPTELPVIVVSANNQSADIVEALSLGANDYSTKPVDFPVVLTRVKAHLAHNTMRRHCVKAKSDMRWQRRAPTMASGIGT